MKRVVSTIFLLLLSLAAAWTQNIYQQANHKSSDSLLNKFKLERCSQLISTLKKENKEARLDRTLIHFLNDFYNKNLTVQEIDRILASQFKQATWRFDEIKVYGDLKKYEGRIRSFGNIEAFISFIVKEERIVSKIIYFETRSRLDCSNPYDYLGLPDIPYLQKHILPYVAYPINYDRWYTWFRSEIFYEDSLPEQTKATIEQLFKSITS
jgi:hypothetical protein